MVNQVSIKILPCRRILVASRQTGATTNMVSENPRDIVFTTGASGGTASTSTNVENPADVRVRRIDYSGLRKTGTAAFLIETSQSNGFGVQNLPASDQITSLANVFQLKRSVAVSGDSWTDESAWTWENFTSLQSEMNLGEFISTHRKNPMVEFAREWQRRIDTGENLPDLYLIQIAWGFQGFSRHNTDDRFNPNRASEVPRENIWHGSIKCHRWAMSNLSENFQQIVHLGLLFNQWEHDSATLQRGEEHRRYLESLVSEHDKIAGFQIPFQYAVPRTKTRLNNRLGADACREGFEAITGRLKTALDVMESAAYDPSLTGGGDDYLGVYTSDSLHYNSAGIDAMAAQMWSKDAYKGVLMTDIARRFGERR